MLKHLHEFSGQTQHDNYLNSSSYTEPFVSIKESDSGLTYNLKELAKEITFDIVSAGTLYWLCMDVTYTKTIEYRKNNGEWTSITSSQDNNGYGTTICSVVSGDIVSFRGKNTAYCDSLSSFKFNKFNVTDGCYFYVHGNIMSMIDYDTFRTNRVLTDNFTFLGLFVGLNGLMIDEKKPLMLPATTLAYGCYDGMFGDCTSLTTAPELPATILVGNCYEYMFQNCTSLTQAPKLPATTLAEYCYEYMFGGCTSLTTAPELPATTLANYCYDNMFRGCSSLTDAPELPATTLANNCYRSMFRGCTSLTTAPILPATTLANYCYQYMFNGCTSLNYIKCLATDISATNCTASWVSNVASAGTFIYHPMNYTWTTGTAGIPNGWVSQCDYHTLRLTPLSFKITSNGNIVWKSLDGVITKTIQYKINDGNWTDLTSTTAGTLISVVSGDTVQFRGDNDAYAIGEGSALTTCTTFSGTTCGFELYGNIMSLTNSSGYSDDRRLRADFTFTNLFKGCNGLTNAGNLLLPAKTLKDSCYRSLFDGCSNLLSGPSKIATKTTILKNHCCQNMFGGCTSLITAPELPSITLADDCYTQMFQGCANLTTAPELPATTLSDYCYYYMFKDCTSLTTSPSLPATTLAEGCYCAMFYGCTGLTSAPQLPATTLASGCYYSMFAGCTSLTSAPSILPATTLANNCYYAMFQSCTSLTTAPELPATTLANYCYMGMFQGCTSLTSAPELPATTLANYCYQYMFWGCTSLNYIKCLATDISATNCTSNWVYGVASAGTFVYNDYCETWGKDSVHGIPSGWTTYKSTQIIPLTFEIQKSGNIVFKSTATANTKSIQYSKDGTNWTTITATTGGTNISVISGETVQFRGDNASYYSGTTVNYFGGSTCEFEVKGNIMSLIDSTGYVSGNSLTEIGSFLGLFSGCTGLSSAYDLYMPATTLTVSGYSSMFELCSNLTTPPKLPATTLAAFCYFRMFSSCPKLEIAPKLPATTLANYCYYYMFLYCTNLTTPPELPSTILASYCYIGMFQGCTSLTSVPDLPADVLTNGCYQGMFIGCTSLTTVPTDYLKVKEMIYRCYHTMFMRCTNLTNAPDLIAEYPVVQCYYAMFSGCSKINYVKCLAKTLTSENVTTNWLSGVSSTGILYTNYECTEWERNSVNGVPSGWILQDEYILKPLTFDIKTTGQISFAYVSAGTSTDARTIQYSINGGEWTNLTSTTGGASFNVSAGDKVEFRGNNNAYGFGAARYNHFSGTTCEFDVYGNIMSLINSTNYSSLTSFTGNYNLAFLFWNTKTLVDASRLRLPSLTLTTASYRSMFEFSSIKYSPLILPATNVTSNAYLYMFKNCPNLETTPVLCGTNVAVRGYFGMFRASTKLTVAPDIIADSVGMEGYKYMFYGCSNLQSVKCLTTELNETAYTGVSASTYQWLQGVASSGTLYVHDDDVPWTSGVNGVPTGWTKKVDPSLYPLTFDILSDGTIKWELVNYASSYQKQIRYRKNGGEWTSITSNTGSSAPSISVVAGDVVQFDGTTNRYAGGTGATSSYNRFSTTADIKIRGNIMSMVNNTGYTTVSNLMNNDYMFIRLFTGCQGAIDAGDLSLSDMTRSYTYMAMFSGCTGLTVAPSLPAKIVYNYSYYFMFSDCTSLVKSPMMKGEAVYTYGYHSMFPRCTSLTDMPKLNNRQFWPNISQCANMFYGCINLTGTTELPDIKLGTNSYNSMFYQCSKLKESPAISITQLSAMTCYQMFQGCSALTTPPAVIGSSEYPILSGACMAMFHSCSALTSAPELPATDVRVTCYKNMFYRCINLTSGPDLPAETLDEQSYYQMFNACTKLNYVKCLATNISATSCTYGWLAGVASSGTFVKNPNMSSWTTGNNGIPTNWTVQDA